MLRFDDSVRATIRTSGNMEQVRETARSNGMRSMQEDAMDKLRQGMTTLEEILRVVPVETTVSYVECAKCNQHILPSFTFCPYCGIRCTVDSQTRRTRSQESVAEGVLQP